MSEEQGISEKRRSLLEYKEKLLIDIKSCEGEILAAKTLQGRKRTYIDSDSDSEDEPCYLQQALYSQELSEEHASLRTRVNATQELTGLLVAKRTTKVLVQPPTISGISSEEFKNGVWRQITAECRVDLISFTISFLVHQPIQKFAPRTYHNLQVKLAKTAHEKELAKSVLKDAKNPSDAIQILTNFSQATRSRRTTLAQIAEKYTDGEVFMQLLPEGGYMLKCCELMELEWHLQNKLSSIAQFYHKMCVNIEYINPDTVKEIGKLYKSVQNPNKTTDERTGLLFKIINICIEFRKLNESQVSDDSRTVDSRKLTLDPFDVNHQDIPDSQESQKEVMAPPKSFPKKNKVKTPQKRPGDEINDVARKKLKTNQGIDVLREHNIAKKQTNNNTAENTVHIQNKQTNTAEKLIRPIAKENQKQNDLLKEKNKNNTQQQSNSNVITKTKNLQVKPKNTEHIKTSKNEQGKENNIKTVDNVKKTLNPPNKPKNSENIAQIKSKNQEKNKVGVELIQSQKSNQNNNKENTVNSKKQKENVDNLNVNEKSKTSNIEMNKPKNSDHLKEKNKENTQAKNKNHENIKIHEKTKPSSQNNINKIKNNENLKEKNDKDKHEPQKTKVSATENKTNLKIPKSSEQIKENQTSSEQINKKQKTSVQIIETQKSSNQINKNQKSGKQINEKLKSSEQMKENHESSEPINKKYKSNANIKDKQKSSEQLKEKIPKTAEEKNENFENQKSSEQIKDKTAQKTSMTANSEKQKNNEQLRKKQKSSEQIRDKQKSSEQVKEKQKSSDQIKEKQKSSEQIEGKQKSSEQIKEKQKSSEQIKKKQKSSEQVKEKQKSSEQIKEKQKSSEQVKEKQKSSEQIKEKQKSSEQIKEKQKSSEQVKEKQKSCEQIKEKQKRSEQIKEKQKRSEQQEQLKEKVSKTSDEKTENIAKQKNADHLKKKQKNVELNPLIAQTGNLAKQTSSEQIKEKQKTQKSTELKDTNLGKQTEKPKSSDNLNAETSEIQPKYNIQTDNKERPQQLLKKASTVVQNKAVSSNNDIKQSSTKTIFKSAKTIQNIISITNGMNKKIIEKPSKIPQIITSLHITPRKSPRSNLAIMGKSTFMTTPKRTLIQKSTLKSSSELKQGTIFSVK